MRSLLSTKSTPAGALSRWVLLDRDGVINEDSAGYVKSVDEWRPIAGSLDALARLSRAGYGIGIITNQSALARGLMDLSELERIHERLARDVAARGGRIAGIFFCPHLPGDGCACRKPRPGLIREAELELGLTAADAFFVGDRASDVRAARAAGCRPVLVQSGRGFRDLTADERAGVPVHPALEDFVASLLGDEIG